jgi:transcriptional regulator with XRE-family HTH domain
MLNIEDFIQRMQLLMDYYNISASVFADRLTVQRSSLSHLMSGRNKPSLDFVMRIAEAYPEADLYWLLYGEGEFPKSATQPQPETNFQSQSPFAATTIPEPPVNNAVENELDLFSVNEEEPGLQPQPQFTGSPAAEPETVTEASYPPQPKTEMKAENPNQIERIVIFYKNGTFKNYNPGQ